jgi:hypothetical protein
MEGGIPINVGDLPVNEINLEESQIYSGSLDRVAVALKESKRGLLYCAVQCTVTEGDYEGMTVGTNYLALPIGVRDDASKKEKIYAQNNANAKFGRFCRAFKIKGEAPAVSLSNPDSIQAFQDWIAKSYGNVGKFQVQNQEFNGRMRSGIADFVF